MAHFAKLDSSNTVIEIVVIPDSHESTGQEYINVVLSLPGTWIQTSYNGTIRGEFAGIGSVYIPEIDIFVEPKPRPWYVLDKDYYWVSPIGIHPKTGKPLEDWQWDYLEVAYSLKPKYPEGLGEPWIPRTEEEREEALFRTNIANQLLSE